MMDKAPGSVGVYPNLTKDGARRVTFELLNWFDDRGYAAYLPPCVASLLDKKDRGLPLAKWPQAVRFAVVLGGDGTLLGAARTIGFRGVPLLGVNLGHFGFLTEVEADRLFDALPRFLEGDAKQDKRSILRAEVFRNGEIVFSSLAMNEASVVKGPYGRMTVLTLRVSGLEVDTYFADGVIISTPTGSTAYSLSAGGPIVSPDLDAMILTPVCAHTLYSRSVVVPSSEMCEIQVNEISQSTMLSLDGQEFHALWKGDRVRISVLAEKVRLLRHNDWSFYDVLRRKMKEGADRLPR